MRYFQPFLPPQPLCPHKSLYGACAERAAPLFGDAWEKVTAKVARLIVLAREGKLALASGGGGTYGKALADASGQLGFAGLL